MSTSLCSRSTPPTGKPNSIPLVPLLAELAYWATCMSFFCHQYTSNNGINSIFIAKKFDLFQWPLYVKTHMELLELPRKIWSDAFVLFQIYIFGRMVYMPSGIWERPSEVDWLVSGRSQSILEILWQDVVPKSYSPYQRISAWSSPWKKVHQTVPVRASKTHSLNGNFFENTNFLTNTTSL